MRPTRTRSSACLPSQSPPDIAPAWRSLTFDGPVVRHPSQHPRQCLLGPVALIRRDVFLLLEAVIDQVGNRPRLVLQREQQPVARRLLIVLAGDSARPAV